MPTLLIGGVAASASHLSLAFLAGHPGRLDLLTLAVSVESFAGGFAGAALIAYMSSLVSPGFAATQYALLSSLYALPGKFVGGALRLHGRGDGLSPLFRHHGADRHSGGAAVSDRLAVGRAGGGRARVSAAPPRELSAKTANLAARASRRRRLSEINERSAPKAHSLGACCPKEGESCRHP